MEFASDDTLRSWIQQYILEFSDQFVKTEVDTDLSTSLLFQERLLFFVLEYAYQSSIDRNSVHHYLLFLSSLWKAVVLFGHSYNHSMEFKETKLALMQADYHLAQTAQAFGCIENHGKMEHLLQETMFSITTNLKNQPIEIQREPKILDSIESWEMFQRKRFLPILLFYINALRLFYELPNIPMVRIYLYIYDLASLSDPIYTVSQQKNFYYNDIIKTTPWKVLHVNNQNTRSPFYLPFSSGISERKSSENISR
ncbi:MAG TPA: hypothetical protein PLV00_04215 [Caldisericia bacterium]|jgi:hypothetical protein|nr:hypothetical protein [Caldisericia bacterium]